VYALSNNHVYANSNLAGIGDNVLQPGPYDGGQNAGDAIGTLADFEPILFGGADNIVDAAIALSTTDNIGNATPSNGYGTPRSATASSFVNQRIQKHGRTTGLTSGKVWGVNTTVNVDYGGGQVAKFVRQILVIGGGFSRGGDSGSLVVVQGGQDDRKPVGLLFAGSSNSTIINPIDDVLAAFSVTIDGN
jgi:hypothetical protein